MGEVKEPYEGGTGSLLEIVDMMCDCLLYTSDAADEP